MTVISPGYAISFETEAYPTCKMAEGKEEDVVGSFRFAKVIPVSKARVNATGNEAISQKSRRSHYYLL